MSPVVCRSLLAPFFWYSSFPSPLFLSHSALICTASSTAWPILQSLDLWLPYYAENPFSQTVSDSFVHASVCVCVWGVVVVVWDTQIGGVGGRALTGEGSGRWREQRKGSNCDKKMAIIAAACPIFLLLWRHSVSPGEFPTSMLSAHIWLPPAGFRERTLADCSGD